MGVDLRIGYGDHYTRYEVYSNDVNNKISEDRLLIKEYKLGTIRCKDMSGYQTQGENLNNAFQFDSVTATIETYDRGITIKNDYFLYAIAEDTWYQVVSVSPNSHNESQRFSSRPIITTTIVIRRAN